MAKLPPNFPTWLIAVLNLIVMAIMIVLGLFLKSIDWRYVVGFLAGYLFVYISARVLHGIWLFNDL